MFLLAFLPSSRLRSAIACVLMRLSRWRLRMTLPSEPSPALLLLLADLGPRDERKSSIKRCRKRMENLRRNLAPSPAKVVSLSRLEPVRAEALLTLTKRCGLCRRCDLGLG